MGTCELCASKHVYFRKKKEKGFKNPVGIEDRIVGGRWALIVPVATAASVG